MQIDHNAAVLVADGHKMLFLRNEGDAANPNLVVEHAEEQEDAADRDQKTDAPGRASSPVSDGRNTMDEPDYHQQEEDRFAVEAADLLKRRALAGDYESLIVIAPPHTLGTLRKHYHVEVTKRLKGELDKDLAGHPLPDVEAAIRNA